MKIVDTRVEPKSFTFAEIAGTGGNVFYCGQRENLFMTLEYPVCAPAGSPADGEDSNAISLVNGDLVWFDCDEFVYPITAEIVLK